MPILRFLDMIFESRTCSKLLAQHQDARELHKPQEIIGVVLTANEEAPLPLGPGKEVFDEPAALMAAEGPAVLSLELAGRPLRRNQVYPSRG